MVHLRGGKECQKVHKLQTFSLSFRKCQKCRVSVQQQPVRYGWSGAWWRWTRHSSVSAWRSGDGRHRGGPHQPCQREQATIVFLWHVRQGTSSSMTSCSRTRLIFLNDDRHQLPLFTAPSAEAPALLCSKLACFLLSISGPTFVSGEPQAGQFIFSGLQICTSVCSAFSIFIALCSISSVRCAPYLLLHI